MKMDSFKKIIDRFPVLKSVELYNWGEPFLNPEIFDMIAYAKSRKVFTTIHSNFSFEQSDPFFDSFRQNGPHSLVISLDGASQESYSAFRVRGDFNLVIDNLVKLKKGLEKPGSNGMVIIWKFIINRYNEHEIDAAKEHAARLGIKTKFVPMSLGDDMVDLQKTESLQERKKQWLPEKSDHINKRYMGTENGPVFGGSCPHLFKTIVINPDGGVFPCCMVTDKKNSFGNIIDEPLENIWNNDLYEYSRSLFQKSAYSGSITSTICTKCNNYRKIDNDEPQQEKPTVE